ncbi:MAG: biotin transporter BioY [Pseudomonadota bacterium]
MAVTAGTPTNIAPLSARLWPAAGLNPALRAVLLIAFGSLLLTISAKIKVPFYPVEMTMQTFVVLLIGATYGWRLALATIGVYLAQGAFGMPVFTGTPEKGLGLAYMMGPTGGFLIGFAVAGAIAGWLAERGAVKSVVTLFGALLLADAALFAIGYLWLAFGAVLPNGATGIGMENAFKFGVLPFVLGDLFKIGLATAIVALGWKAADAR